MLNLPQVTLCAVASLDPDPALLALKCSMRGIKFASVKLLSGQSAGICVEGIEQVKIQEFSSAEEYSVFMLAEISKYIHTEYALFIQWDGFIIHPDRWQPNFLDFDYIGAVWPQFTDEWNVGNGGFSLRSKRLLEVLRDSDIDRLHPEDVAICRLNRRYLEEKHDIRFAPAELAMSFAFERSEPIIPTFGFHGLFNFHHILDCKELGLWLDALPKHLLGNRDSTDLCYALLSSQDLEKRAIGKRFARRVLATPNWRTHHWKLLRQWRLR